MGVPDNLCRDLTGAEEPRDSPVRAQHDKPKVPSSQQQTLENSDVM
jgi:hypothetical protein